MQTQTPNCPICGDHKGRIGVEIRGVYDGVLFWNCRACGFDYHRFTDLEMQKKAIRYMNQTQEDI